MAKKGIGQDRFIKQNNNFARAAHFFCIFLTFFAVPARSRRESALYDDLWRTRKQTTTCVVSFYRLNLGVVPNSSSAEKLRLKFDILSELE